jgi:hypothetical protein
VQFRQCLLRYRDEVFVPTTLDAQDHVSILLELLLFQGPIRSGTPSAQFR